MNRKTQAGTIVPILMAMLYGVSPLDLIPDLLPVIGLVDDAVVIPLLLLMAVVNNRKRAAAARVPKSIR